MEYYFYWLESSKYQRYSGAYAIIIAFAVKAAFGIPGKPIVAIGLYLHKVCHFHIYSNFGLNHIGKVAILTSGFYIIAQVVFLPTQGTGNSNSNIDRLLV